MKADDNNSDQLRARIRDLELTLGQGDGNLLVTFRLTPVLNNLLGLLLTVPNVTPEMIRQRLEIAPDAKVAIHRLRKHLEPMGIIIESKRNVGYWLSGETKTRIRAMMAEAIGPEPVAPPVTSPGIESDDGDVAEAA